MNRSDLPIDTPCGAEWSQMAAAEARTRLCAECNKVVHDLSAMSEREVRAVALDAPAAN